jgi:Zn-dependent protease/CBS domain-containing protein
MRESVRLGTIAGVRVGLNVSVFVIMAILVFGLAAGRFPAAYPGRSTLAYITAAVVAAVLFFLSLLGHELAHATVARRYGIEVRGIVLWLFGGVAELKGEPQTPRADFRIAVVGPLTSFVIAVGFGVVAWAFDAIDAPGLVVGVFGYLAGVNLMLAVFNLVPAAPLDGGRILRAGLWAWRHDRVWAAVRAARAGRAFGYILITLGFLQIVSGLGLDGLWLVLIGLFLVNAATAEEQQAQLAETLHGVTVGHVMSADPVTADPHERLDQFVARGVWTRPHSTYPLVDDAGRLVGLATLNRIRAVPVERRSGTTMLDIACRPHDVPIASADEPLVALMPRMADCADGRAVVVDEDGRVIGIVSPRDISRAIELGDLRPFDPYQGPRGADIATPAGVGSTGSPITRTAGAPGRITPADRP